MKDILKSRFFGLVQDLINTEDSASVNILHAKVNAIYDCITIWKFLEENDTLEAMESKTEKPLANADPIPPKSEQPLLKEEKEMPVPENSNLETIVEDSLEELQEDPVFVDTTSFSQKAVSPTVREDISATRSAESKGLNISLEDRSIIIETLFNGETQDFTRVISQINYFSTFKEAQDFIQLIVKPDYKFWHGKEKHETLLMNAIKQKYGPNHPL